MRQVIATRPFVAVGDATVLAIESPGHMVYLSMHGQKFFEISSRCDTCPYAFTKLVDASSVDLGGTIDRLRNGIDAIDDDLIGVLSRGLPAGEYIAALLDVTPTYTSFGEGNDYFTTEQGGVWEAALVGEGGRHFPRTGYYRLGQHKVDPNAAFFEFLIPSHSAASHARVEDWKERIESGKRPVALSLAFGEHRQPANWEGEPSVTSHMCVSHYLLDGHHRVAGAERAQLPIRLLTAYAMGGTEPPPWAPNEQVTEQFLRFEDL